MAVTADGAAVNRCFVRLHSNKRELVHKTINPCSTEGREFYFISDPPHLIKTTRNCWASSKRMLWVNTTNMYMYIVHRHYNTCI